MSHADLEFFVGDEQLQIQCKMSPPQVADTFFAKHQVQSDNRSFSPRTSDAMNWSWEFLNLQVIQPPAISKYTEWPPQGFQMVFEAWWRII